MVVDAAPEFITQAGIEMKLEESLKKSRIHEQKVKRSMLHAQSSKETAASMRSSWISF